MLTPTTKQYRQNAPLRQKGVMLLITLIILVAMTLAAIALVRSVDTTNLITGNMAFQQSSYDAGDIGIEQAIGYMYNATTNLVRNCDSTGVGTPCVTGYKSFHEPALEPPTAGQSWDSYWARMKTGPGVVPMVGLPSGYSGAFVIESMCTGNQQVNCLGSTVTIPGTNVSNTTLPVGINLGCATCQTGQIITSNSGVTTVTVPTIYYRITTRVEGPRNSVSYVQAQITL